MPSISSRYLSIGILSAVLLAILATATSLHIAHFQAVEHKVATASQVMTLLHKANSLLGDAQSDPGRWPRAAKEVKLEVMPQVEQLIPQITDKESR